MARSLPDVAVRHETKEGKVDARNAIINYWGPEKVFRVKFQHDYKL